MDALTDRQLRFVFEYLRDQNACAAALRAGYAGKSRAAQGGELMKDPLVRERIRMEMAGRLAELGASALDLIRERVRAAFFRAGKLFDASGRVLGINEMEEETRKALIVSLVFRKGEAEVRLRQPNREPALRALERVHERLDKLNEQHYAAQERRQAPRTAAPPSTRPLSLWTDLKLDQLQHSGPAANTNVVNSGTATTNVVPPPAHLREKPQVLSGSPAQPAIKTAAPPPAQPAIKTTLQPSAQPAAKATPQAPAEPAVRAGPQPQPGETPNAAWLEYFRRRRQAEAAEELRLEQLAPGKRGRPRPG